jgi:hypothetical protein
VGASGASGAGEAPDSTNPIIGTPDVQIGISKNLVTGAEKKATGPKLPQVSGAYDKAGNVVLQISEDAKLPLTPAAITPGIRADLTVTIPPDASQVRISGTVSGSPSFEANVCVERRCHDDPEALGQASAHCKGRR